MGKTKNTLLLLLTAFIWGVAFVAQSVGMDYVGPFTFNCVRSIIGGLVLIPCIYFLDWLKKKSPGDKPERSSRAEKEPDCREGENVPTTQGAVRLSGTRKDLILGGICCGVVLGAASSLQQIGIAYTTVGKAGFITALYIVLVPVMGIFLHKRPRLLICGSVVLAVAGLYFLCMTDSLSFSRGDSYVLACAFLFSIHILVIDYFSPKVDGVKMSCIQFFVAGLLCGIPMLLYEQPSLSAVLDAKLPILYAGVLSCGVAYTLQIVAQKDYDPTVASLLLSLESVFSVLAGWVILGQTLSGRELLGCVLMFLAVILAQLPEKKKERASGPDTV